MRRGDGPAITGSGKCERMMYAGERQFKVVQTWRLKAGRGVELTTKLIDPKGGKKGAAATNTGSCEASEGALSTLALEKAEAIMAGKREAARRQGVPQSGGGRSWADNQMCCPVIASIKGSYEGEGTRTRNAACNAGAAAGPTEPQPDWRDTSEPFLAAMRGMGKGELLDLLAKEGVAAADQLRKDRAEARDAREMVAATRKALAAASTQGRTNEGRRTFQTILTACSFDGDGPSRVTAKRKAELLGVHPDHLTSANMLLLSVPAAGVQRMLYE